MDGKDRWEALRCIDKEYSAVEKLNSMVGKWASRKERSSGLPMFWESV
jgi:hypothetical protein